MLTLPVFIFIGFDSNVANATNRVAILFQNMAAIHGFRRKKILSYPYSILLGIAALFGAILGARLAVIISDDTFDIILALVMLTVSGFIIFNPFKNELDSVAQFGRKRNAIAIGAFFLIGIYGGFIQAGVGVLIMAALALINKMDLVKANSVKVVVVFTYTLVALGIFMYNGLIEWKYGLTLAVGQATGGFIGSYWTVSKGDIWIKRVLIVMIILMALKLLGLPLLNP